MTSSPTGSLDDSHPVEGFDTSNGFREKLSEKWPSKARCLIIAAYPDAYEQNDKMLEFFKNAAKVSGLAFSCFDLQDHRNVGSGQKKITEYDVIFLSGGHVPTENLYFKELNLREKMKEFDGIVIGISAGSMNSADLVYAQPEEEGESTDPNYQRFLTGLGLTRKMILPHYQMVKDFILDGKHLYRDITAPDSYGREFLVLSDGSYLLIEGEKETVYGEAWYMRDGKMIPVN